VSEYDVASAQTSAPFAHPADEIEAGDDAPAGGRGKTAEAFHRLFLAMIPDVARLGVDRQMKAGYHRMCALAYRVGPDEFWPGMTSEEVAVLLGISWRAFQKHLEHVDEFLRASRSNR
jgi:hypothetical protein